LNCPHFCGKPLTISFSSFGYFSSFLKEEK